MVALREVFDMVGAIHRLDVNHVVELLLLVQVRGVQMKHRAGTVLRKVDCPLILAALRSTLHFTDLI